MNDNLKAREEHLAWCKQRALEYLDDGDLRSAVASMGSDLTKYPETNIPSNALAALLLVGSMHVVQGDVEGVRRWIEGFN